MKTTSVRKPSGQTREMDKLYDRLVYWLYERQNARRARPFAERLALALARFSPDPESIFIEECRSLVSEARGDLAEAIRRRENEIRLIRRLHEISRGKESESFILGQYGYDDLRDRLILLAMLCRDGGDVNRAISTLRGCKRLCARHGIPFGSDDLLRDYMKERYPATKDISGIFGSPSIVGLGGTGSRLVEFTNPLGALMIYDELESGAGVENLLRKHLIRQGAFSHRRAVSSRSPVSLFLQSRSEGASAYKAARLRQYRTSRRLPLHTSEVPRTEHSPPILLP
jgi:hypothetical protein